MRPALVTLDVWGVPLSRLPRAFFAVATGHRGTSRYPGVTFTKTLGTGSGITFAPQDADARHWALLACWDALPAAAAFERSRVVRRWRSLATERLTLRLEPLTSRGRWSGQEPFGGAAVPAPSPTRSGAVVAITRARIRPSMLRTFWRSVPPVAVAARNSEGLLWSLAMGEAPLGLQGTVSLWRDQEALHQFAYRGVHTKAIAQTRELGWYAEELFATFAVTDITGTFNGRSVMTGEGG